jgi:uncharacterized protein
MTSRLKAVIDTNVLVSALLKDNSLPAFILALVRRGTITLCLSTEIFDEYKTVLKRDKFHGIRNEAAPLLSSLRKDALLVEPSTRITVIKDDPEDNKFLECAVETEAGFLITGNTRHFPFKNYQKIRIVSPKEFIDATLEHIVKEK